MFDMKVPVGNQLEFTLMLSLLLTGIFQACLERCLCNVALPYTVISKKLHTLKSPQCFALIGWWRRLPMFLINASLQVRKYYGARITWRLWINWSHESSRADGVNTAKYSAKIFCAHFCGNFVNVTYILSMCFMWPWEKKDEPTFPNAHHMINVWSISCWMNK